MPDLISVNDFIKETWDDYNSPTASNFVSLMTQCRNTVNSLDEVKHCIVLLINFIFNCMFS